MTPLSPRTTTLVEKFFPQQAQEVSAILIEQCGQNLPFWDKGTPESLERVRFAVLKISGGKMENFKQAVTLAKQDWRDLLLWADFGNDLKAHVTWADEQLGLQ